MGNLVRTIKNPTTYIDNVLESHKFKIENITVEHRSNNTNRDYLFVNKKQCKHIPCRPSEMIDMCDQLASNLNMFFTRQGSDITNRVLVITFAETAIGVGKIIASKLLDCNYVMTTTREQIKNSVELLQFEEEHSHATTHKLLTYNDNFTFDINNYKYILFVEDEITTGKTILNFIEAFEKKYNNLGLRYGVASICNWQSNANRKIFTDKNIDIFCLIQGEIKDVSMKINLSHNTLLEFESRCDNKEVKNRDGLLIHYPAFDSKDKSGLMTLFEKSRLGEKPLNMVGKSIAETIEQSANISELANTIDNLIARIDSNRVKSIRVIGTEEFMYIPILIGAYLEEKNYDVICHSTTRSPIDKMLYKKGMTQVNGITDGIISKYKIPSPYERDRVTYIYNIDEYVDLTLIITDANMSYETKVAYYDLLKPYCDNIALYNI